MRRTLFVFIAFCLLSSLLRSQNDWNSKLKTIEAISNDSIALNSLQVLAQKNKSNLKALLNINLKIITRANLIQKYSLATSIGNESAVLANKNSLDSLEAVFHKYIGVTNYYMDRKKAAVPFFEKALEIAEKNNYWELEASCNNNIGAAFTDIQEYEKAEPYLLKSIEIMKEHGKANTIVTLRSYRVLARMYSESAREKKAEPIYLNLIEKSKELKDTALLCDNLIFYSEILARRGELNKAVKMSGEALAFRRKQKSIHDLQGALNIHAINLALIGRHKEAYTLEEERALLMRTIFAKDLEKEISEVEVKYKTAQLQQEKELSVLKAKKQKQIYLLSIVGILLLSVGGIYVWNQRKKAKHLYQLAEADKIRFKEVIEAEEKERSRIAQELHDGLGQLLSTARLNVAGLEDSVSAEDKAGLNRSLKIIDDACVEVRSISHNMMPSALIRLGLIPAINEVVNNVNSAKGIKIDFTTNVESSLGKSLDITIYRVVQEILNNMIRHAKATNINIDIEKAGDDLKIEMKDNGVGFNTEELKNSNGIGWKNIFSRISMLDGDIKLESELQKGTIVFINLKLKNG
ncbi:MAG: sensor histidine kinase [Sphingobacteriaceae bacterium]|nr:sensor histidine kinase [Sphingobacteriaceae bacterium]